MFADDTSLYSAVTDENKTAEDLNRDLEAVRLWAWQWKMHSNSDKTEEVLFSTKRVRPWHLGNDVAMRKAEHKHLGMTLDTKLNFQSHVKEPICKARRGIGVIRYLSKYAGPPRGGVAGATAPGPGPRQGPVKIKLCFSIICFCDIIELGPARGPEESNFHLVRSTLH